MRQAEIFEGADFGKPRVSLARALSEYRSALIQHGFTREEALVLVGRYQDSFIGNLHEVWSTASTS